MIPITIKTVSLSLILGSLAAAQTVQLTNGSGGGERQPVLSADGQVVAYAAIVNGVREVMTVPAAGGAATKRTNGGRVFLGYGTFESWPSLSLSGDGTKITYWNAGGVHVIDTRAKTDKVLATAYQIPYPQVDAAGQWVVYQAPVNGDQEVFLVRAAGGTATQLTKASGAGRRLPHIHGSSVVYQKPVGGFMELFLYDVNTKAEKQLTKGSGPGNRYGRFAPGGKSIVYEAITAGCKEVWTVDPANAATRQLTSMKKIGDRLPVITGDNEVFFQSRVGGPEIHRVDDQGKGLVAVTQKTGGGLRRPMSDAHGHAVVFQAIDAKGILEVWLERICPEATISEFGQHGKPSTGTLRSFDDWYRCDLTLGLDTSLPKGGFALYLLGFQRLTPAIPLPSAPGNFLYVRIDATFVSQLDANGDARQVIPIPRWLKGAFYYQWGVLDRSANALGVVTSKGSKASF